jgi:hypothetical protein
MFMNLKTFIPSILGVAFFCGCSLGPPNMSPIAFSKKKRGFQSTMELRFERTGSYTSTPEDRIKYSDDGDGKMEYSTIHNGMIFSYRYENIFAAPFVDYLLFGGGVGAGVVFENIFAAACFKDNFIGKNTFDPTLSYQLGVKFNKYIINYDYHEIEYNDFETGPYGPESAYRKRWWVSKVSGIYLAKWLGLSPSIIFVHKQQLLGFGFNLLLIN